MTRAKLRAEVQRSADRLRATTRATFSVAIVLAESDDEDESLILGAQVPEVSILRDLLRRCLESLDQGDATIIDNRGRGESGGTFAAPAIPAPSRPEAGSVADPPVLNKGGGSLAGKELYDALTHPSLAYKLRGDSVEREIAAQPMPVGFWHCPECCILPGGHRGPCVPHIGAPACEHRPR